MASTSSAPKPPSRIRCASKTQRAEVLALLAGKGIASLGGRPVSEVVQ